MGTVNRFSQIDGYLSANQLSAIQEFFQTHVFWTYGWQSDKDKTPFGHWNHDFLKTQRTNQENHEHLLSDDPELVPIRDLWLRLKDEYFPGAFFSPLLRQCTHFWC